MLFRRPAGHADAAGAGVAARPPRLVLRFALVTAVGIAVAGAGILLFVRHHGTVQAENAVAFHARFVADSILRGEVGAADFQTAVTGERRVELDGLFRGRVLSGGALRARLIAPDGLVTYSTDHALIGTTAPDAALVREALRGTMVTDVAGIRTDGGAAKRALVAYLPVRFGDNRPVGVFELSQDYAPIAKSVKEVFLPIAGVLQAVLVALFVSLFPLLHGVTKTLRRQMRKIEHQAVHDDLTTLPNRVYFRERVEEALERAREGHAGCAVMLVDLDRFKEVNDTLGHQSGDLLLQELGTRLRELRGADTAFRLGGDEFAVLSVGAGDAASARMLAERIRKAIEEPFVLGELTLEVGASVGIALFPEHGDDVETLVRHADVAMYVSKKTQVPKIYAAEDDHYTQERLALVADLRRAIDGGELELYYQPCVDVRTGELSSVEALVRWQHRERGLLLPADFLPVAEENGLVRGLTAFVLDRALGQARAWRDHGIDLRMSVNLSGADVLDLGLPDQVRRVLDKWEIEPSRLEVEISENTLFSDPARAQVVLMRLSERGVSVAIDDFGTGYSSLRYLKRLPVDTIKIDQSFVVDMASEESDAVIIRSTIDLGHNLDLKVVAEGVESEGAWTRLAALGCDTAQGFYISRPLEAAELTTWLRGLGAPSKRRRTKPGELVVTLPAADGGENVVPLRAS